jgi:ADP-ribose pyrophosphatase YjhB (NUDIX family)
VSATAGGSPSSKARSRPIEIGLTAVIAAVTDESPRVLVACAAGGEEALPSGPLDPATDRTLELALRGWVREGTGVELGYVEQLYTFGNRYREPRERAGGPRVVAIAYLALVREAPLAPSADALWRGMYEFLPWEDWRAGRPGRSSAWSYPRSSAGCAPRPTARAPHAAVSAPTSALACAGLPGMATACSTATSSSTRLGWVLWRSYMLFVSIKGSDG